MEEEMNLLELSELLLDEKKAEEYLLKVGILKTFTECEKCGSNRITKISRGRHRCSNCESEWSMKKGSVLYNNNLSYSKFIGIVKLFELGITAELASIELNTNHITVKNNYNTIRFVISGVKEAEFNDLDQILRDELAKFSISITDKGVEISLLNKEIVAQDLFKLKRTRNPSKEAAYSFHYSRLKPKEIEKRLHNFPIEQNHFWRYAKKWLMYYRGTKLNYLYLYLKEIEFRYNSRNENLFEIIIAKIAQI